MSRRMVNIDNIIVMRSFYDKKLYIGEKKNIGDKGLVEWIWKYPIRLAIGATTDKPDRILIGALNESEDTFLWVVEFSDLIGSENFKIERKEEEEVKA